MTYQEVFNFLELQRKVVDLKPQRKIYFKTKQVEQKDGFIMIYSNRNEVYSNGEKLKYIDRHGNYKEFTDELLNNVRFELESEDEFRNRLEFSNEMDELLSIQN